MTETQYWDGDCLLVIAYNKAFEMQKQRRNQELWLQGAYFFQALLCAAPVYNPMSKSHEPGKYLEEPIPLSDKEAKDREARKQQRAYEDMKRRMDEWRAHINKNRKGGKDQNA